jgi:hypothetical protein
MIIHNRIDVATLKGNNADFNVMFLDACRACK